MNIVETIFSRADRSAPALYAGDTVLSYGRLLDLVDAAAAVLPAQAGQRVGLNCPNGIAHIVWSLALLRRGAVLVPVAPELSDPEREEVRRVTRLAAVLQAGGKAWPVPPPAAQELTVADLPPAQWLHGFPETPPSEADFSESELAALNPALIRFSSGTTGRRKGVVLSHKTLLERVNASNTHLGIGPQDRVIWTLPMAHHFAVSIILYLLHGAATVLENSHLGADVMRALATHQGTVLYASPFHYSLLASCPEAKPVPSLRLAVSTAAPLPLEVAEKFRAVFGLPLRQGLGIIECGLPLLNDLWAETKPGSVGRPQTGYAWDIRDEQGQSVPVGETGALYLRGPGLVDAYLTPWQPRALILQDGWFRTGDHARADADGAIWLAGRSHSVINVGGMKCFPEEVEACLNTHPGVRESRVSSQPHPAFGSVPVAEYVPVDPASPPKLAELISHCRTRLSGYKIPLKFMVVNSLPKTPSGKIQR